MDCEVNVSYVRTYNGLATDLESRRWWSVASLYTYIISEIRPDIDQQKIREFLK